MEQNGKTDAGSLESELRQMILGNIRIGETSGPQNSNYKSIPRNHNQPFNPTISNASFANSSPYRSYNEQQSNNFSRNAQSPQYTNHTREWRQNHNSYGQRGGNSYNNNRGDGTSYVDRSASQGTRQIWTPSSPPQRRQIDSPKKPLDLRIQYLDQVVMNLLPTIEMDQDEMQQKDKFRQKLESILLFLQSESGSNRKLSLEIFGSLKSGFAFKGSDMDLVIHDASVDTKSVDDMLAKDGLPRSLEKELLSQEIGARLLPNARVPIIKICERPLPELLDALRAERAKFDQSEEKDEFREKINSEAVPTISLEENDDHVDEGDRPQDNADETIDHKQSIKADKADTSTETTNASKPKTAWLREKKKGPLDFPKEGVGIQCDINFFNPLGLHNSQMLYCYSLCDNRVRPIVLFIKAWAKKRRINAPRSGTLSSYGYVLMVLHFLINVARPPVLPNLQLMAKIQQYEPRFVDGWEVCYVNNQDYLIRAASEGTLTSNQDSIGSLLKSFFQYYASSPQSAFSFVWKRDVISLRTRGGLVSKEMKGWTGAKTESIQNVSAYSQGCVTTKILTHVNRKKFDIDTYLLLKTRLSMIIM